MHNTILEISRKPLSDIDWTSEEDFFECDMKYWDYMDQLFGEDREERLKEVMKSEWFSRLFIQGEEPDVWIYNGKLDDVLFEWGELMKTRLNIFIHRGYNGFTMLKDSVEEAIFDGELFCLPDMCGTYVSKPYELLFSMKGSHEGDRFYVCSVYDYHL